MRHQLGASSVECQMQFQRSGCCQSKTLHPAACVGPRRHARKPRLTRKAVVLRGCFSKCATVRRRSSGFPPGVRHAKTARRRSAPPNPDFVGAPAAKRPVLLASTRSGSKNAGVRSSPNAFFQANAAVSRSHSAQAARGMSRRRAVPNPSFKRSANGRPPGPGRRYPVHFRQPGPGVLPSSPA